MKPAPWTQARKFLCVRLDSLGDVLMCTPAMRAIKESAGDCSVTLLSSASGAAVAPFVPEIDDAIIYAAPWMKGGSVHAAELDWEMVQTLRTRAFDAAIIFTSYSQSALPAALLCQLADIPLRLAHCRENPYQLLTDWVAEAEPQAYVRHEVRRQLELVAAAGFVTARTQLSFSVRAADLAWMRARLGAMGMKRDQAWVLLHPGATAPSRRYPSGSWARIAQTLTGALGLAVILTGDADEVALAEDIRKAAGIGAHSLAGELDLGRLGAAIALAAVVVSNNTGPAHMAAAISTPQVNLYALTNPQHTPWQVRSHVLYQDVPCRFCYKSICPQGHQHCLSLVEPARVVAAVQDLLHEELTAGMNQECCWPIPLVSSGTSDA